MLHPIWSANSISLHPCHWGRQGLNDPLTTISERPSLGNLPQVPDRCLMQLWAWNGGEYNKDEGGAETRLGAYSQGTNYCYYVYSFPPAAITNYH